jgi:anthranilate synthase component 2
MELISKAAGKYPMLGICLGHQALIQYYGGTIERAPEIVHGKSSDITHLAQGAFANISNPLPVARYHSLVATKMPEQLETIAYVNYVNIDDSEVTQLPMAIEHKKEAALGFQFHPESILTTYGSTLLAQSLTHLAALANAMPTENLLQGKCTADD